MPNDMPSIMCQGTMVKEGLVPRSTDANRADMYMGTNPSLTMVPMSIK